MNKTSEISTATHVCLTLYAGLIPIFFHLLQEGFRIDGNVGCSVRTFLCEQQGIAPEYLEKRIQTIFLNGKPVDNVDTAIVEDGSTLSLSAALPGLVGAVMRRGGHYAPMREQISYKEETSSPKMQAGKVFIKLFNLPLRELGPMFLEHGILVGWSALKEILAAHDDDFRKGCRSVFVDGRNFDLNQLQEVGLKNGEIFLQIKSSLGAVT